MTRKETRGMMQVAMGRFEIDIPSIPLEEAISVTSEKATVFKKDFFHRNPNSEIDERVHLFFRDLEHGSFWHVLNKIDEKDPRDELKVQERENARHWVNHNFEHEDLQEIFSIVVNTALLAPENTSWPGTYKGHSILYREIAQNERSIFHESITPEFEKRLNNGRFWEEAPEICMSNGREFSQSNVVDVLLNHYADLDVGFAKEGLRIYERNRFGRDFASLNYVPELAVRRYGAFIKKVDARKEELDLPQEEFDYFVRPYVEWFTSPSGSKEREGVSADVKNGKKLKSLQNDPLLQRYMGSEIIRSSLSRKLLNDLLYGDAGYALKVLRVIPNDVGMFGEIVDGMRDGEEVKFLFAKLNSEGLSIESRYLAPFVELYKSD